MRNSSVKCLAIIFDRESGSYKPGELVSGNVVAEFSKPKKIRGLRLEIFGESVVSWFVSVKEPGEDKKSLEILTASREEYIATKPYLLGSDVGRAIELPVARLVYPFSFQLPIDLPSSLEHNFGYVRYTIKAIFDRPWKFNYEVKTAFTVVSNYDLNQKPQALLPIEKDIHKRFCCFCICPWGKLHAKISIPSTGFVPGQTIPVTVYCENESTVDVSKIKVILKKKLKFYATVPQRGIKEEEIIVATKKNKKPFTASFEDHVTIGLKVPSLPPSGLEYCGIIDLDYTLSVLIRFSGMHCNAERSFPVLIGTVPLYNSFSTYNPDAVLALPPSVPLLLQETPSSNIQVMPQPGSSFNVAPSNPQFPGHQDQNNLPPPSYEASMYGAKSIKNKDDSEYVEGAGSSFAPRYPVYNYWPANTVTDALVNDKQ